METMLREHSWIAMEKQFFGQTGSAYDFSKFNMTKERDRMEDKTSELAKLGRTVNKKVCAETVCSCTFS